MNTATENQRLVRLFWKLALWFCVIFPLVCAFGLNAIVNAMYQYLSNHPRLTDGSRLFWEICISILEPIIGFARIFFHFFGYGLFALSLYRFGWRNKQTWYFGGMALVCLAIYPLCGFPLAVLFTESVSSYELLYITYNALFVFAVELGIFCILALCDHLFVRANSAGFPPIGKHLHPRKHPLLRQFAVMVLVHGIARLIFTVYETCTLVIDYGAPTKFGEFLSLAEPYLSLILYSFVGYFTLALLAATAENHVTAICPEQTDS